MAAFDPLPVIQSIWTRAGLPLSRLPQLRLSSPGPGPALASSFKVAELAQVSLGLSLRYEAMIMISIFLRSQLLFQPPLRATCMSSERASGSPSRSTSGKRGSSSVSSFSNTSCRWFEADPYPPRLQSAKPGRSSPRLGPWSRRLLRLSGTPLLVSTRRQIPTFEFTPTSLSE